VKLPNTVHTILKSALKAARDEDRPDPPWHLDAQVRPVCPARGQIALAVTLAELCAPTATVAERKQLNQILAVVRKYLSGKAASNALKSLSAPKPIPATALGMAYNAVGACITLDRGKADLVSSATQAAAAKAVKLWEQGAPTRQLLEAIDHEILCLECACSGGAQTAPARRPCTSSLASKEAPSRAPSSWCMAKARCWSRGQSTT